MQKIIPHLWFDKAAVEAAEFYVSTFGKDSQIQSVSRLEDTPSGSTEIVAFTLLGREFQAISAGPEFKLNPSVSFHVLCKSKEEVDSIWSRLSQGGSVLMELGSYPFSERYGWVNDKYGLSWQVFYSNQPEINQKITPVLTFTGKVCGKAEEAVKSWVSIFPASQVYSTLHYGKGEGPDQEGTLRYAAYSLAGLEFGAMDSAYNHPFSFNEAISFMVKCETQEEIDSYWNSLSAVPEAEQCGWLKDKYGVSWQIVPTRLGELLSGDDPERIGRVTQAFLAMKKFDLAGLHKAYEGK
jgi:predicted 3-demethylubiquinone-9 3-methyltransferase (glyoxalase superfamily)